jgi:hypothetical protein
MAEVFLLYHSYGDGEDYDDHAKLIGIYTSQENAEAAIRRVRDQPGFRTRQDGFRIHPIALDVDGWSEGFVWAWRDGSASSADDIS